MEETHLPLLLSCVTAQFPEHLDVSLNNTPTTLHRYIQYNPFPSGPVSSYHPSTPAHLNTLLEILDFNLGAKYASVSRTIYENREPWQSNKMAEMETPGLVYVSYHHHHHYHGHGHEDDDTNSDNPLLFLSFMLTTETGVLERDPEALATVIFLYEIQLLPEVRRQSLGRLLLGTVLRQVAASVSEQLQLQSQLQSQLQRDTPPLAGIELTVFSDNAAALQLYTGMGMRPTPLSPRDTVTQLQPRRTRSGRGQGATPLTCTRKPVYYLYCMPVGQ